MRVWTAGSSPPWQSTATPCTWGVWKAGAARDDMLAGSGAVGGSLSVGGVDALLAALQGDHHTGLARPGKIGDKRLQAGFEVGFVVRCDRALRHWGGGFWLGFSRQPAGNTQQDKAQQAHRHQQAGTLLLVSQQGGGTFGKGLPQGGKVHFHGAVPPAVIS